MREALGYACDTGDGERALMLAGTIWRFWWNRGYTRNRPTGIVPLPSAMTRVRLRALEVCSERRTSPNPAATPSRRACNWSVRSDLSGGSVRRGG